MAAIRRLWNEEDGAIVSSELVLVATLLVIGMVTGLSAVRTAVVTELGDVAAAIGAVNQSYSFGGVAGHHSTTAASSWVDGADSCDTGCAQLPDENSSCLAVCTQGHSPG